MNMANLIEISKWNILRKYRFQQQVNLGSLISAHYINKVYFVIS